MRTNKKSVSIGIVARLDGLTKKGKSSSGLHDHSFSYSAIVPFLEGGELPECGRHLVTEGGGKIQHDLVRNEFIMIGDTAGFTLNTGLTVRGMDLAAGPAVAAATAVDHALETGDRSRMGLERHIAEYKKPFVGEGMATYAKASDFLGNDEMYGDLGSTLADVLYDVYNLDLTPHKHIPPTTLSAFRASGLKIRRMAKIDFQAMRSL